MNRAKTFAVSAVTVAALGAAAVIALRTPEPRLLPTAPTERQVVPSQPRIPGVTGLSWWISLRDPSALGVDIEVGGSVRHLSVSMRAVSQFSALVEWVEKAGRASRKGARATFALRHLIGPPAQSLVYLRIGIDLGNGQTASPLAVRVAGLPKDVRDLVLSVDEVAERAAVVELAKEKTP